MLSSEIINRMNGQTCSPPELYVLARDLQAFLKKQVLDGDKAGGLGQVKTKEMLHFPDKKGLLFNHTYTK